MAAAETAACRERPPDATGSSYFGINFQDLIAPRSSAALNNLHATDATIPGDVASIETTADTSTRHSGLYSTISRAAWTRELLS
jgi:hypothetical protein